MSYFFGTSYPVATVDAEDLARVWEVMSKSDADLLQRKNIAVAIGQVLRPESDAQATIFRASLLHSLQTRNTVPAGAAKAIFETAATLPIERPLESQSEIDALARFFIDQPLID
jgi:hypothetical protein